MAITGFHVAFQATLFQHSLWSRLVCVCMWTVSTNIRTDVLFHTFHPF